MKKMNIITIAEETWNEWSEYNDDEKSADMLCYPHCIVH